MATDLNHQGIGVKVLISPGTYRETLSLLGTAADTPAPIIFEAATTGSVVISGSDVWTGWTTTNSPGVYGHQWPYKWGFVEYPAGWADYVALPDIVRRREMVFVNGNRLRQVLSPELLTTGTFYVSESAEQIQIVPQGGVTITEATVEVAARSSLFLVQGKSNVVIRGLRLQHDNDGISGTAALSVYNASNILIEDTNSDSNNNRGFGFATTSQLTVRRSRANGNGFVGIGGWKMLSTLFEDAETSYNNWRGADGGFTDWDPAGTKLMLLHNAALVRSTIKGNQTYGLWLDTDCADVLIQGSASSENLLDGVFLEALQGPVTIRESTMSANGHAGVLIANSAAGVLADSALVNNAQNQVFITGDPAGRVVDNFETGQHYPAIYSSDWSFSNNKLHASTESQSVFATTLAESRWQDFVNSMHSNTNCWFNPYNAQTFRWVDGLPIDFGRWKSLTQQDQLSTFTESCGLRSAPRAPVNLRLVQ